MTSLAPSLLIAGSGSMACLFAARLAAAGIDVTMLANWPAGLEALQRSGVTVVEGDGRQQSYPVKVTNDPQRCAGVRYALVLVDVMFWLDTPRPDATVFGLQQVSGYILGDGTQCGAPWQWPQCEWGDSVIVGVDLYIDGGFVASADLFQPRYDILLAYPWYAGTPFERPGFAASFDTGNFANGVHTLFVRVRFVDGTEQDFGQRTVIVNNLLNQAPFGELDLPGPNQPMNGVFPVTGWALDDGEVTLVDGPGKGARMK